MVGTRTERYRPRGGDGGRIAAAPPDHGGRRDRAGRHATARGG
ncbi:hypothetical protein [Halorubrum sp. CSM-61]|nr:hypothetical protein [Halorubrum sp. CSM-61]